MKRLCMITLSLVLLLSQWGSLAHAYHVHKPGDVCDYCLSAHPLDHSITATVQTVSLNSSPELHDELLQDLTAASHVSYYTARAPPGFI